MRKSTEKASVYRKSFGFKIAEVHRSLKGSVMRECLARKHDQSGIFFLLFSSDTELFQVGKW